MARVSSYSIQEWLANAATGVRSTEFRVIIRIMGTHIFRFPAALWLRALLLVVGAVLASVVWAQGSHDPDPSTGSLRLEQVISPGFSGALADQGGDAYPPFVLGVLDLERRRDIGREGGRQLAVEGEVLNQQIVDREAYMAALKDLALKQEVVIQVLKSRLQQRDGSPRAQRRVASESTTAETAPEQYMLQISALLVVALLLTLGLYLRSRFAERRLIAAALRGEAERRHGEAERRHAEAKRAASTHPVSGEDVSAAPVDVPEEVALQQIEAAVKVAQTPQVLDVAQQLREIDTLLAYEDYEGAGKRLLELIDTYPENPEFRLRLLHLQSVQGDTEASAAESEILATMMDGPLSDTLRRVRSVGHDMLPEHPLFSADSKGGPAEESEDLQKTQVLNLTPKDGKD